MLRDHSGAGPASDCQVKIAWPVMGPFPDPGGHAELLSNGPAGDEWHVAVALPRPGVMLEVVPQSWSDVIAHGDDGMESTAYGSE